MSKAVTVFICCLLLVLPTVKIPEAEVAHAQSGCSVDLMLVLDGSGSIQPSDFAIMKSFVRDLAGSFNIGPQDANIGIIQFSNTAELYLPLSSDEEQVMASIDNMTQFGDRTNIAEAIDVAQSQFVTRREGIPRVIIVLTDGLHNMSGNPVASADIARSQGTSILGLAVGNVDITELIDISGGPENVITVGSFDGLDVILDILLNNTCAIVTLPGSAPPAQNTGDDGQETASNNDTTATPPAPSATEEAPQQVALTTTEGGRPTQVAFASDRDGDSEIFAMNADGTNLRQLTFNTANDDKPSWSKDGRRIAFESNMDGDYEIYLMNADGSNLIQLTNNNVDDYGPAFSPDGSMIAYHTTESGNIDVYIMNADGSSSQRITSTTLGIDRSPSWSPDGSQLVYYSDDSGGREIYIVDIRSKAVRRLSDNAYYDGQPDWSLNGTQVVFASTRQSTNPDIYIMRIDGTNVQRLTVDPATDDDPVWSPDGRQIAFESTRAGNYDIWMVNADGSGLTQLTTDPARDWSADWIWVPVE